ncbi:MAG: glutathione S-transferase family protein [Oscillatoriales cyanobacterium]|nr:MAG: glutathione S-transferase family protein [Oscillatoriales cyanobacterium]
MLLLQFSTSPYCRKVRLALGYKGIPFQVENLTPGLHVLKLKPLTGGLRTVPVLLPQLEGQPGAIALEDWLDESIGIATRFVYYEFRAGAGKEIDPSLLSQLVIQLARRQFGINRASAKLAELRLSAALGLLQRRWQDGSYLVGDSLSVADITAVALLSPLALIPQYRIEYPWLLERIVNIHEVCGETLPPGF